MTPPSSLAGLPACSPAAKHKRETQGPTSGMLSDKVSWCFLPSQGTGVLVLALSRCRMVSACSHFCRASSNSSMPGNATKQAQSLRPRRYKAMHQEPARSGNPVKRESSPHENKSKHPISCPSKYSFIFNRNYQEHPQTDLNISRVIFKMLFSTADQPDAQ